MISKQKKLSSPLPIFDSLAFIEEQKIPDYLSNQYNHKDIQHAVSFLKAYKGSQGTFNAYRREIERLIHWGALISYKNIKALKREDIENYLYFCQRPPKTWMGKTKPPRFIEKDGQRIPNSKWRPFTATVSKIARRKGDLPDKNDYDLSQGSLKEVFAILSSFFSYLVQEEYVSANPVAAIRQKSQFIRKASKPKIRRLSELQWQYVINTAKELAENKPAVHERTLFMMSILYSMYLRISELAANERWAPLMNHFYRDNDGILVVYDRR